MGSTRLLRAALALLVLVGVVLVLGLLGGRPAPSSVSAPPSGTAPAPVAEHADDYSSTDVEELLGHVDHLDFDRLDPSVRAALEEELAKRDELSSSLWSAYGSAVAGSERPLPSEWAALDRDELSYVLLSARAVQLGDALSRAGSLPAARALPGVGPDHALVAVAVTDGCVSLSPSFDPYGRTFSAPVAPSPGPLQERLSRARVGVQGAAPCAGSAPSFSPAALRALAPFS